MNGRRSNGKVGIALAGGGPLGAIYEIGALVALEKALREKALRGVSLTDVADRPGCVRRREFRRVPGGGPRQRDRSQRNACDVHTRPVAPRPVRAWSFVASGFR